MVKLDFDCPPFYGGAADRNVFVWSLDEELDIVVKLARSSRRQSLAYGEDMPQSRTSKKYTSDASAKSYNYTSDMIHLARSGDRRGDHRTI